MEHEFYQTTLLFENLLEQFHELEKAAMFRRQMSLKCEIETIHHHLYNCLDQLTSLKKKWEKENPLPETPCSSKISKT